MNSNASIVIEKAKLTNYLLKPLEKNDKSGFLNSLGYTLDNWQELEEDIHKVVMANETRLLINEGHR